MAKSAATRRATRRGTPSQPPRPADVDAAIARPNAPVRRSKKASKPTSESAATSSPPSSLWHSIVSSILPLVIVTATAYVAVAYGFTTAPEYVRSKRLMAVFKAAFVVLVCLGNRSQLAHVYSPANKPKTLPLVIYGHLKSLLVVVLANCAGTTVIQPLFGEPPKYAATVELVIPTYIATEVAIGLLAIPTFVIQFFVGFLVSWLKAATTSTLVMKWQQDDGAHPIAFVLICTCNLFASGFVLRYVAHYHASRRVVALSFSTVWSLVKTMGISAVIGVLAYVANHYSTQQERQIEATVMYFAVAWYALDKYWKPSLRHALVHVLTSTPAKAKTA